MDYRLLRSDAVQSGVGYPKFCLWVSAQRGDTTVDEGAVRVAVILRTRFEVSRYLSKAETWHRRLRVAGAFPAQLVAPILSLAKAR